LVRPSEFGTASHSDDRLGSEGALARYLWCLDGHGRRWRRGGRRVLNRERQGFVRRRLGRRVVVWNLGLAVRIVVVG